MTVDISVQQIKNKLLQDLVPALNNQIRPITELDKIYKPLADFIINL